MKTNFTNRWYGKPGLLKTLMLVALLYIVPKTQNRLVAQCSLDCTSYMQFSLDEDCYSEVTPDMLLNANKTSCPTGVFEVILKYNGKVIPTSPWVDETWINKDLSVTVRDTVSGNSCWGTIHVEDKLPPVLECKSDTFFCYDLYKWKGPKVTEGCGNPVEIKVVDERIIPLKCDTAFVKRIERDYTATDKWGNTSSVCTDTIFLKRIPLDSIVPPKNWVKGAIIHPKPIPPIVGDTPAISCVDVMAGRVPLLDNGAPSWEYTGVPTVGGFKMFPNQDVYCNTTTFFHDVYYGKVGCVEKWIRFWTIQEWWCNGDSIRIIPQGIEIVDTVPPVITCPPNITMTTTGGYTCEGSVWLPVPEAYDSCQGDNITIDVTWPGGFYHDMKTPIHAVLPVGHNKVTYRVYDARDTKGCYNMDSCSIDVWVRDQTAPVVICKKHTVISLTYDSTVHAYAKVFDNGSYDDCCIDSMLVRRMDEGGECGYHPYFRKYVEFCCADVGKTVMVILRVYDCHGNFNDCMVEVDVQDKMPPKIFCPSQFVLVPCEYKFEIDKLGDYFGKVVGRKYDRKKHTLYGNYVYSVGVFQGELPFCEFPQPSPSIVKLNILKADGSLDHSTVLPIVKGPRKQTLEITTNLRPQANGMLYIPGLGDIVLSNMVMDGYAHDNCKVKIREKYEDFRDQCGVGFIRRTFYATDQNGTDSCCQYIGFYPLTPFTEQDIVWPADTAVFGCHNPKDFGIDVTGKPKFNNEDECSLVGYDYTDQEFKFFKGTNLCFKLVRKWRVLDWCYKATSFDEYWSNDYHLKVWNHTQYIKALNNVDPEFTLLPDDNKEFCTYDLKCRKGPVNLVAAATDDCTPGSELRWEMHLDLNCDGIYDSTATGLGDTIRLKDSLALGWHCVKFIFEDRCGNQIVKSRNFHVISCKNPTPYCNDGIAIELMPVDLDGDNKPDWAMLEVWASDFDLGSYGACGHKVTLSFSPDTTDKSRMYDCDSIGRREVQVWVTDLENGKQAFCVTHLEVQDNNKICPTTSNLKGEIAGNITNRADVPLNGITVQMTGSATMEIKTSGIGHYQFPKMPFGGSYEVIPNKKTDYLYKVNTRDLLTIQFYLLGKTSFNQPYKYIAADATMDSKVSTRDISIIRKLILGKIQAFPAAPSWIFLPKNYSFKDPNAPFDFPTSYHLDPFDESHTDMDFYGIKVGDVNGDDGANGLRSGSSTRSKTTLELVVNDMVADQSGEEFVVPVRASDLKEIAGLQLTFRFDPTLLELTDVSSGVLSIKDGNLGLYNVRNGYMTLSWNTMDGQAIDISEDKVLFSLIFKTKAHVKLSEALKLSSDITPAEAFGVSEDMNLRLRYKLSETTAERFILYQNIPNPFEHSTRIGFELPEATDAVLTIFDMTGKALYTKAISGEKGYNEVNVKSSELNTEGVLYYQLGTKSHTATKKMVVLGH